MSFLTIAFALLFYAATAILLAGLAYKIFRFAKTPSPLKIATTPAPVTETGVVLRMFREVVFFESLFRGSKWTWTFGWVFHMGLLVVLIRHLRYVTDPVWGPIALIQPFGVYAGFAMVAGLGGLWARRFLVDRVRYISAPSDHLILILLILIGVSGLTMKFIAHTDVVAVKQFFMGLMTFSWSPLPADFFLVIHLLLVAFLMIIFPYSKLLHAPGVFFSPTRNQVDNPREKRHIAAWARKLEEQ
jgi:nitrate reductase gamma subunit